MPNDAGIDYVVSAPVDIKQGKALDLKCPILLDPRLSNEDVDTLIATWRDLN